MNNTEAFIREWMARLKIKTVSDLANRLGFTRQRFSYRLKNPSTFTSSEIKAMAKLFNWSDEDLGKFIRSF